MTKTEISHDRIVEEIRSFYDPCAHHFLTVNGIDLGEGKIELQWIFSSYGVKDDTRAFYAVVEYGTVIPSVVSEIPSAYMSEREIVDLFGLKIEGAAKGLYLDEDSLQAPLRSKL